MVQTPGHLENWSVRILESFEKCSRRMQKIKWSENITNEVLERTGEKRTLLNDIQRTKSTRLDIF